ncbi:hypothetical protein F2Q68_00036563 [Brassica cretica]|uniref:sucrose synthase n=1 Tax=Brassica cretica TaxID=69181 RepID=A0A8S9HA54_BRACR|nr:hypothetical protein F2Q68_00036563 [Brassica cretica]
MPTGRFETMREWVHDAISAQRNELLSLFSRYVAQGKGILQSHQLIDEFLKTVKVDGTTEDLKNRPFMKVLQSAEEAIVLPPFVALAIRPRPGVREYVRVNVYELSVDHLTVSEYLRFKEELVNGHANGNYLLELDFEPFNATFPRPTRSSSIGNGVQFLNRHLSSIMFRNKDSLEPLLEFLRTHKHDGRAMMLNDRIQNIRTLQEALARAEEFLSKLPLATPYSEFEFELQGMGFERGWGDTAQKVSEMVHLLLDILQAPDPSVLETFLGRIPMIIENGVSGFHIDPYHPEQLATTLVSFFETCNADPSHWEKISDGGLKRIYERYTWKKYSERLLTLAGVYSFWKHVSKLERRETRRYLEMFYSLKYRDLANSIPLATDEH